jgi:hypothetical protein
MNSAGWVASSVRLEIQDGACVQVIRDPLDHRRISTFSIQGTAGHKT